MLSPTAPEPVPEPVVRKPPRHRPGTYIGKDPIAKAVGEKNALPSLKQTLLRSWVLKKGNKNPSSSNHSTVILLMFQKSCTSWYYGKHPIIYKVRGFIHPRWLAGFLPSTSMLWVETPRSTSRIPEISFCLESAGTSERYAMQCHLKPYPKKY